MELYQAHEATAMLAKVCVVYIFHSRGNVLRTGCVVDFSINLLARRDQN